MIAMEEEVPRLLMIGSGIVLAVSFMMIILWWRETKHSAFGWLISSLVCLTIAIYIWISVIGGREIPRPMISENNSLLIGYAGIIWAVSMALMLEGIFRLKPPKKRIPEEKNKEIL